MATKSYMGSGDLINRLSVQVGSNKMAIKILQGRGHLEADGKTLTLEGERRNNMTSEQRAIDRASKRYNQPGENFKYNPDTNSVRKIKNIN
jgi:hypothetical protein